jgi:hypothetical protein
MEFWNCLLPLGPDYFVVILQSKSVSAYKTTILLVMLDGFEKWSVILREERWLRVFENTVLRFVPRRDEVIGEWRRLRNEKLYDLYVTNIYSVNPRRMKWMGHAACTEVRRGAYRALVGRRERSRPLGRPRRKWEGNIKMYLKEM